MKEQGAQRKGCGDGFDLFSQAVHQLWVLWVVLDCHPKAHSRIQSSGKGRIGRRGLDADLPEQGGLKSHPKVPIFYSFNAEL